MSRDPRSGRARSSSARRRRRAVAWRGSWPALLIALGLILAQGPMLLHLLIVRHVTCEHGELVESAAPVSPGSLPSSSSIDHREEQSGAEPGDRAGAEHEHCDALGLRHRPTEVRVAVLAAMVVDIDPPAALAPGHEERSVPILALAPKSSPPAA